MIDFVREYAGKKWLLIFYHNLVTSNDLFEDDWDLFLRIDTTNKYSILYQLTDVFKSRGKFEFLLLYPELSGHNIWTQTVNPLETEPESFNGYEPVDITWSKNWCGISRSNNTICTFLDATRTNDNYWFAIGQKRLWHESLAGPLTWNFDNPTPLHEVAWYIRIDRPGTCQVKYISIYSSLVFFHIFFG